MVAEARCPCDDRRRARAAAGAGTGEGGPRMRRVGIISVDGHVKAPWSAYREYLDPQWREPYDAWVQRVAVRPDFCHTGFGPEAQWNAKKRVADLEAQGVIAEVVFPNGIPFAGGDAPVEATRAGA